MAKYFIDTEFLEGFHKPFFGKKRHFIDLISIGIVEANCPYDTDGDGNCPRHPKGCPTREYYAISNEFDLEKVWNNYDLKPDIDNGGMKKVYWLRENVLKPIFEELCDKYNNIVNSNVTVNGVKYTGLTFTKFNLQKLLKRYGKSNKQIAEEVVEFIDQRYLDPTDPSRGFIYPGNTSLKSVSTTDLQFYGYYADYDWVLFCSLFGRMIDLPSGFPMYCKDLKQELDRKVRNAGNCIDQQSFEWQLNYCKNLPNYPKQTNEHNALADAKWDKKLYEFLNTI